MLAGLRGCQPSPAAGASKNVVPQYNRSILLVVVAAKQSGGICAYQDCDERIASWYKLCRSHNGAKENGEIDECPRCGQYKDPNYPLCRNCNAASGNQSSSRAGRYEPEYNPQWETGDEESDVFFIYILKLDGGKFYAGHTRELRERMSEHRDGKTRSTAGKHPSLVWFDVVDTRKEAADGEAYMKELIDKNDREVRRIITEFHDLIREVDLESDRKEVAPQASRNAKKAEYSPRRFGYRRQPEPPPTRKWKGTSSSSRLV